MTRDALVSMEESLVEHSCDKKPLSFSLIDDLEMPKLFPQVISKIVEEARQSNEVEHDPEWQGKDTTRPTEDI